MLLILADSLVMGQNIKVGGTIEANVSLDTEIVTGMLLDEYNKYSPNLPGLDTSCT